MRSIVTRPDHIRRCSALACGAFAISLLGGAQASLAETTEDIAQSMGEAESGCTQKEFNQFLDAFIASPAVRARYTAPQVEQRGFRQPSKATGSSLPASAYQSLNVSHVDWQFADSASVARWRADPNQPYTALDVKFEDLPDGSFKFTYQPAILRDDEEGDGWTVERHIGKPAAYLFSWRSGCWQLTQDYR